VAVSRGGHGEWVLKVILSSDTRNVLDTSV
jgi:hypothetical protein